MTLPVDRHVTDLDHGGPAACYVPENAADVVDPCLKATHIVIDPHVVGLATERTSPGRLRFALERLRKSPVLYLSKHVKRIEKVSKFILLHLDAHHQWEPAMATKLDERSTELAQQLATLLGRFLDGEATVEDLLDFEAPLAFDRTLNADLRHDLSRIALFGEEIERSMRPLSDLREYAEQALARASVGVGVVEEGLGVVD